MNKLVLLDLDETVLDKSYQITDSCLPSFIDELQAEGVLVGIHSDTPLVRQIGYAKDLHCSGPLVTELGNAIAKSSQDPTILWEDGRLKAVFQKTILALIQSARNAYPFLNITLADVSEVRKMLSDSANQETKAWMICHSQRFYSLGFYVYDVINGTISFNASLLSALADIAEIHFVTQNAPEQPTPIMDVNHDYGICIMHDSSARKAKANEELFRLFPDTTIYMVGNSMSDFLDHPEIVQCAVGNASDELKKQSTFVAPWNLSSSVISCLEWIRKQ